MGALAVEWKRIMPPMQYRANLPIAMAHIGGRKRIVFDMLDGVNFVEGASLHENLQTLNALAENSDFYCKRSYNAQLFKDLEFSGRIHPYGLHCDVTSRYSPLEYEWSMRGARNLLRYWTPLRRILDYRSHELLSHPPRCELKPLIIFQTHAWQISSTQSASVRREMEDMNESRAMVIRTCRKHFGSRFIGGFTHSSYARAQYVDCLLDDERAGRRKNFQRMLPKITIGIATSGIHRSNGWKLAEYVAASRAIVSEPLFYEPGGTFLEGENYLTFKNRDSLIGALETLLKDVQLRESMMFRNYCYYRMFGSPCALLMHALQRALVESSGNPSYL